MTNKKEQTFDSFEDMRAKLFPELTKKEKKEKEKEDPGQYGATLAKQAIFEILDSRKK